MPARPAARSFSLRKRVAWWLTPPLVVILLLNAFWFYRGAIDAANRAYDRSLIASLKSIAESIHSIGGNITVDLPYSALEISEEGVQERVYYAIIGPDGTRLTGYDDLPLPAVKANFDEPIIADLNFREQAIRLAGLSKRLYDPELVGGDAVTVLFAETTEARKRLAFSLFLDSLRPQFLLIIGGLLLLIIVLKSAFRPLLDVRNTIRQRKGDDLTPVSPRNVPNELLPLVDAVNHHMSRLENLLQARRRFLADAAHQMRTPLTVLGTQAEYGQRQNAPDEMRRTFASLAKTIRGTQRMTNQMLTLARAEPANGLIQDFSRLDFADLVCDVAGDLAPLALKKKIDLSFDAPLRPAIIDGNATMLREMVSNLVDNAVRYTHDNGSVALSVAVSEQQVIFRVTDNGPGIPETEREKVFQRFYRILGQCDMEGSGLGLAIVREICRAHRGEIQLSGVDTPSGGAGLVVQITLPAAKPELALG